MNVADMETPLHKFLEKYPDYILTRSLDELRQTEYNRLDSQGLVYVDYTGGGLYADSQIRDHMDMLRNGVFGNPHSANPSSEATTRLVESARAYVLKFFNASPEEYVAIFTANATGALKLVGEAYPFQPDGRYLLTFDNHNSVNGIREYARTKGTEVTYLPVVPPDLRVDEDRLDEALAVPASGPKLFAYPAQSNFSGVKHPLDWIEKAHDKGWDVMVDCAAYVPTNRLDLSEVKPDFVPLSFYKMFGYPTGVGCLIARKDALKRLTRPWFAGGTITIASVQADSHFLAEGVEAFEDGTVNYLNLPAIEIGLRHLEDVGIGAISDRVTALTGWLLDQFLGLRHSNGASLVRVFGPTTTYMRGATITANFYDPDEKLINHSRIEELASEARICLRSGCFCNPGAGEVAHGLTKEEMEEGFKNRDRMTFEQFQTILERIGGKSAGAVRISLGLASNFDDVYRVVEFARGLLDRGASQV